MSHDVLAVLDLYKLLMRILHRCAISRSPLTTLHAGVLLLPWRRERQIEREHTRHTALILKGGLKNKWNTDSHRGSLWWDRDIAVVYNSEG